MRLAERAATFFLSEDGEEFFGRITGFEPPDVVTVDVQEADDMGIWIQIQRESKPRVLLLRWEFILGIELPADSGNVIGLRG